LRIEVGPEDKLWEVNKKQRSCNRLGACSALLGMAMSQKRQVRAGHMRAGQMRAAWPKPH